MKFRQKEEEAARLGLLNGAATIQKIEIVKLMASYGCSEVTACYRGVENFRLVCTAELQGAQGTRPKTQGGRRES